MSSTAEIAAAYYGTGVVLDSNILLLLVGGTSNRRLIGSWPRLKQFTTSDYDLLVRILTRFRMAVTTPAILAEVNSLANKLTANDKPQFYEALRRFVGLVDEKVIASKEVVATDYFKRFGYTDACVGLLGKQNYLVLTDDFALSGFLLANEVQAINFNHLR